MVKIFEELEQIADKLPQELHGWELSVLVKKNHAKEFCELLESTRWYVVDEDYDYEETDGVEFTLHVDLDTE